MSARRKLQRSLKKRGHVAAAGAPQIRLSNPVKEQFESFIIGNALAVEAQMHDGLLAVDQAAAHALEPYTGLAGVIAALSQDLPTAPAMQAVEAFRVAFAESGAPSPMAEQDSAVGQTLVIAGAGPSLADHVALCEAADQVWGCNSALTYLADRGHKVTHGFTVDQTPAMLNEWASAPDVEYLLASTVHPHLTELLQRHNRSLRWFHNYVGIAKPPVQWPDDEGRMQRAEYEDWLYVMLYPATFRCGSGLNAVTRALDLACWMGFDHITVLGADCALRVKTPMPEGAVVGSASHTRWLKESTQMHADGGHALASGATPVTMNGEIDGRTWVSKPDLLISAVWLEKMRRNQPDRIALVGDTLPVALRDKSETFLGRLPALIDSEGRDIMVPTLAAASMAA